MSKTPSSLKEIDLVALGNECTGKRAFKSRFVIPLALSRDKLERRIADLSVAPNSFLELAQISDRDKTAYFGRLTDLVKEQLGGLLISNGGRPTIIRVKDSYLQPLRNLMFNPENRDKPISLRISAIEFFPFSHGKGALTVTVEPPPKLQSPKFQWPLSVLVDLNYYLSHLNTKKQSQLTYIKRNNPDKCTKKSTYITRILSVVTAEITNGKADWEQIWENSPPPALRQGDNRALVYTHACMIPSERTHDSWTLTSGKGVKEAERILLNLSQYREQSLKKPSRYKSWAEGQEDTCRIHGYTPANVMGVLLNGQSPFDATQYPQVFHNANFFLFLIAFSMRYISDQLSTNKNVPEVWQTLFDTCSSTNISLEPIRETFFRHCLGFFGVADAPPSTNTESIATQNAPETTKDENDRGINYKLVVDRHRRTAILYSRINKSGHKYQSVLEASADQYFRILRVLAARTEENDLRRHMTWAEVLYHYDNETLGKDIPIPDDCCNKKQAYSRVNSIRRKLEKAGIPPEDIIGKHPDGGIHLQPSVKVEMPKRDAHSGALRDHKNANFEDSDRSIFDNAINPYDDQDDDTEWNGEWK